MTKSQNFKPIESLESEQSILGGLLSKPAEIFEVLDRIRPEDFYHIKNQIIFRTMAEIAESGTEIELSVLFAHLKEKGEIEQYGGKDYLVSLLNENGYATNIPYHVDIIFQKSTLRRLSEISGKVYRACFNGHKPNDLIVKLQEDLTILASGMGGVKKGGKIAVQVREWIKIAPGSFEARQIYNDLGLRSAAEKKAVLMELGRLEKETIIERIPGKRGWYRIVEDKADKIDFMKADSTNWLDINLPLGIEKYVHLFPTNIIIVAGEKGSGKTAFCLDVARMNKDQYPIRYLSSEMAAEELRDRLEKFGISIEEWSSIDFRSRRDNFADLIDPDGINIIDFLEKYDQFWTIASDIRAVFDKLKKGICFIAIQKDKGTESGRGGMFTREKCRLHIALSKKMIDKKPVNEAKIDDVKVFALPGYNPNGLVMKYKLINGARFELAETVREAKHGSENW